MLCSFVAAGIGIWTGIGKTTPQANGLLEWAPAPGYLGRLFAFAFKIAARAAFTCASIAEGAS